MGFDHGDAAGLGSAGAGGVDGVEAVDVEADVAGGVADDAAGFGDRVAPAVVVEFVHGHDAHAALGAEGPESAGFGGGTAQADLDTALWVECAVFDGLAEGCAVVVGAAHVVGAGVAVGVDVNHADGTGSGSDGAEDGGADGVVAADGEGGDVGRSDGSVEGFDFLESGFQVVGAFDPAVAEVADASFFEGSGAGGVVVGAKEAGLVADFARAVASAGSVGHAAVEGDADDTDVDLGEVLGVGGAKEGGDAGVAGLGLGVVELGVVEGGFERHGQQLACFGGVGESFAKGGVGGLGVAGEEEELGQLRRSSGEAGEDAEQVGVAVDQRDQGGGGERGRGRVSDGAEGGEGEAVGGGEAGNSVGFHVGGGGGGLVQGGLGSGCGGESVDAGEGTGGGWRPGDEGWGGWVAGLAVEDFGGVDEGAGR